jgi:hypothetical protein
MLILVTKDRVVQATKGISRIRADDKCHGISRISEYSTDFEWNILLGWHRAEISLIPSNIRSGIRI